MAKPLTINCQIDSVGLVLRMRNGHKRLAYAAVNAINKTAKRIQRAERERVEEEFVIRRPQFMERMAAIIKPFASVKQGRAFAEIAVGQKPRLLLSSFERGAERRPVTPGAQFVAAPVIGGPARPDFHAQVPAELRMSRLRFDRTKTGKARAGVTRTSTFLIPAVGIFQRMGEAAAQAVYVFVRGQRLEARLRFKTTARRIAQRWFREEFNREVIKAIERTKGAGL